MASRKKPDPIVPRLPSTALPPLAPPAPAEPPKRTGRPPTGIKNVGRSVSMPIELWEWVESQALSRSEFIEALVRKAKTAQERKNST